MNRLMGLLLSIFLLSVSLPSTASAAEIKGKVIDAQTGEPIARARVTGRLHIQIPASGNSVISETRDRTILTDAEGNFVFHNADVGYLELTAQRIGYITNPAQPSARLQIRREQPPDPVNLQLTRQAVLEGRLTGERGQPLSGQITLYYQPPRQAAKPQQLRTAYADRHGEFRFATLESGRYFLRVTNAGAGTTWLAGKAYPPRYYPDRTDLLDAQAFNLSPGKEEHVEFALPAIPAHQIHGRYVSGERPGISLDNGNGEGSLVSVDIEVDEKMGTFTVLGVPAGVYTLRANWGNGASAAPISLTIEDGDVTGIVLTPERTK